jgi:hypothetical protein
MSAGEVKLAAGKVSNGSHFVEFAVSDTGIGSPADKAALRELAAAAVLASPRSSRSPPLR